jgi:hypothetical protein
VIAEIEDDGVVEQPISLELRHRPADDVIDQADAVEVAGLRVAEERRVGKVGGQGDFVRIVPGLLRRHDRRIEMKAALVRFGVAFHVEKGLRRIGTIPPRGLLRRIVPGRGILRGVVVLLGVVRGVVARFAKETAEETQTLRQLRGLETTVRHRAEARRVASRRERGPRHRADRGVGEGAGKGDPLAGERLDVRRFGSLRVEELQVVLRIVLRGDPDDVGPVGGGGGSGSEGEKDGRGEGEQEAAETRAHESSMTQSSRDGKGGVARGWMKD